MCLGKVPFSDRGAPPPVPVAAGTRVDVQEILTYRLVDAYYDQARIHVFLETGPADAYMRWPQPWLVDDRSK